MTDCISDINIPAPQRINYVTCISWSHESCVHPPGSSSSATSGVPRWNTPRWCWNWEALLPVDVGSKASAELMKTDKCKQNVRSSASCEWESVRPKLSHVHQMHHIHVLGRLPTRMVVAGTGCCWFQCLITMLWRVHPVLMMTTTLCLPAINGWKVQIKAFFFRWVTESAVEPYTLVERVYIL